MLNLSMLIIFICLILGTIVSIEDDFIEMTEQFNLSLLIGFAGDITDDIAYQITASTSLDITEEAFNNESEIDMVLLSASLVSFLTFFSATSSDLAFNSIESFVVITMPLISFLVIGLDNTLNESYNGSLAAWLWPFFTILELLTLVFRGISLSIRITSNGLAGHVLVTLLILGFT